MIHSTTVLADLGTPAEVWELPFEELSDLFSDPPSAPLALVWGARFAGRRTNAACVGRSIIAIDVDGDRGELTVDDAAARCRALGCRAFIHTTKSHQPFHPRTRVLVEVAGVVPNDKAWKSTVWKWVCEHWPEHDGSGKDIARFSWAPRADRNYSWAFVPCEPLRWESLVPPAPEPAPRVGAWVGTIFPTPPERTSRDLIRRLVAGWPSKGRHYTHLAVAGWLAKRGFPANWVAMIVGNVCLATGASNRIPNRLAMVESTYARLEAGGAVSGFEWLDKQAPGVLSALDAFETSYSAECLRGL